MRALITLLIVSIFAVGAPAEKAGAEEVCHTETQTIVTPDGTVVTKVITICEEVTTSPGNSSGEGECRDGAKAVPCVREGLVWLKHPSGTRCYAKNVSNMFAPPEDFPLLWNGHTDGALWECKKDGDFNDLAGGLGSFEWTFWLPAGATPLVDPTVLAQQALDQMTLAKPDIHLAPSPPEMTYVGLDTWLWMDENQFGSLSNTVSAGGASVTVTAAPVRASWDMGDGSGTSCPGPGRPWVKGMTSAERTGCSYAYRQVSDFEAGGDYDVTVSLVYQVDWTCTGPCLARDGSLGEVDGPTSNAAIRVGERQSVVVGGNR